MAIESQRTIYPGQGVRVTVNITDATNASALTDPTTLIATLQAPGDDVGVGFRHVHGRFSPVPRRRAGRFLVPVLGQY